MYNTFLVSSYFLKDKAFVAQGVWAKSEGRQTVPALGTLLKELSLCLSFLLCGLHASE